MAEIKPMKRVFKFKDRELPDPNPTMTTYDVIEFYSAEFPELASAYPKDQRHVEDTLEIDIALSVGTNG